MLWSIKVVVVGLVAVASVVAAGPASADSPFAAECAAGDGVFNRTGGGQLTTITVGEGAADVSQHSVLETTSTATAQKYVSKFVREAFVGTKQNA